MRRLVFMSALFIAACLTTSAFGSLSVGDRIRFSDGVGTTGGGEFGVYLKTNVNPFPDTTANRNAETFLFTTFCLEKNEYIDFDKRGFIIESISKQATAGGNGGGNPDPISAETAWLFYNFTNGTLAGYSGNTTSANYLQYAIWGFENEISQNSTWNNNPFVIAAKAAVLAGGPDVATAVARTFVINILWATDRHGFDGVYESQYNVGPGNPAQSMLYIIPEPGTIAVWTVLGLAGLGAGCRRRDQ